jgi:hypothetical protein
MLASPGQVPTYIILDGLDECSDTSGRPSPRERVLMLVEKFAGSNLPNLRVCIASRPTPDIQAVLHPLTSHSISLHDEGGQDPEIRNYITSVVYSDPKIQRWKAGDKELVIDELSRKADGT